MIGIYCFKYSARDVAFVRILSVLIGVWFTAFAVDASAAERHYAIALDDSGSMGNASYAPRCKDCDPGNDPERLAPFAIRALLSALPDSAHVSVMTMGSNTIDRHKDAQKHATQTIPHIGRLSPALRKAFDALLLAPEDPNKRGDFTRHDLWNTPCERVLDGLAEQLNRAWKDDADVVQTAVFLGDGKCTGKTRTDSALQAAIDGFLASLHSERAARTNKALPVRPFQFHLICLGAEGCSEPLKKLAENTGGTAVDVMEATDLIDAFAHVLGNSQNVCPLTLQPGDLLPNYPGSTGTRLILVPATNQRAQFETNAQLTEVRAGEHFWPPVTHRFVTALLAPQKKPIRPPVLGGKVWRLLAIPEYRTLQPTLHVRYGSCDHAARGREAKDGRTIPQGSSLCVQLTLEGEAGEQLRWKDLGRPLSAELTINGEKRPKAGRAPDDPRYADQPVLFEHEVPNLTESSLSILGELTLEDTCVGDVRGSKNGIVTRKSSPFSAEVRKIDFDVQYTEKDSAPIEPGDAPRTFGQFAYQGNIDPDTRVHAWIRGDAPSEESPHQCVGIQIGEHTLGYGEQNAVSLRTSPGATQDLTLRAGADCGFQPAEDPRDILIVFAPEGLPTEQTHTVRYQLSNRLNIHGEDDALILSAGQGTADLSFGPARKSSELQRYRATVRPKDATPALPSNIFQSVTLAVLPADEAARNAAMPRKKRSALSEEFVVGRSELAPLALRGKATGCCSDDNYKVPIDITALHDDGGTGNTTTVWMDVTVESNNRLLTCWLPLLGKLLLLVLGYLILRAICRYFTRIHLLPDKPSPDVTIQSIVKSDATMDGYERGTNAWTWSTHASLAKSGKRRRAIALSAPWRTFVRGKEIYETAHLTFSRPRNWSTLKLHANATRRNMNTATVQELAPGMYFTAGKNKSISTVHWVDQNGVLAGKNAQDILEDLYYAEDAFDAEESDAPRTTADKPLFSERNFYLIVNDAHEKDNDETLGFHVKAN